MTFEERLNQYIKEWNEMFNHTKFPPWPKRTWVEWPECIKGKCGEWINETTPELALRPKKEVISKLHTLRELEQQCHNIIQEQSHPKNQWFWYKVTEYLFLNERPELERQLRRYKLREYTGTARGRITDADMERARQRPISDFIQLNQAGYAKCPFHNEHTASFNVNKKKNLWFCFGGCSEGGDSIKFIMQLNNLSFIEAVKFLCKM